MAPTLVFIVFMEQLEIRLVPPEVTEEKHPELFYRVDKRYS